MAPAKYNPPSPRSMGVEKFIEAFWRPKSQEVSGGSVSYGYRDFVWWVKQGLNAKDIARAFGHLTAKPVLDMIKAYNQEVQG
jgi:hypothetical protein